MSFAKDLRSGERWRTIGIYAALGPPVGFLVILVLLLIIGLAVPADQAPGSIGIGLVESIVALPIELLFSYMIGLAPACLAGVVYSFVLERLRPRPVSLLANALVGGLAGSAFLLVFLGDPAGPPPSLLAPIAALLAATGAGAATACALACARWPPKPPGAAA